MLGMGNAIGSLDRAWGLEFDDKTIWRVSDFYWVGVSGPC